MRDYLTTIVGQMLLKFAEHDVMFINFDYEVIILLLT